MLVTPPIDAGVLEGITRDAVMELARQAGIEVREMPITRHDVYIADECFLTGTAVEVIAVVKVDSRKIGNGQPGPITRDLKERFHKLAQARTRAAGRAGRPSSSRARNAGDECGRSPWLMPPQVSVEPRGSFAYTLAIGPCVRGGADAGTLFPGRFLP